MKVSLRQLMKERKKEMLLQISDDVVGDIEVDLFKETYFNPEYSDLAEHLSVISGQMSFWSVTLHKLEYEQSKVKTNYDIWFARKCEEVSDRFTGKPSVSAVEKSVIVNNVKEYQGWQTKLAKMKYNVSIVETMLESLKEKGIALSVISKINNAEYNLTR